MYLAQNTNKVHFDTLLAVDKTAISICSLKSVYGAKAVPSSLIISSQNLSMKS